MTSQGDRSQTPTCRNSRSSSARPRRRSAGGASSTAAAEGAGGASGTAEHIGCQRAWRCRHGKRHATSWSSFSQQALQKRQVGPGMIYQLALQSAEVDPHAKRAKRTSAGCAHGLPSCVLAPAPAVGLNSAILMTLALLEAVAEAVGVHLCSPALRLLTSMAEVTEVLIKQRAPGCHGPAHTPWRLHRKL